MVEEEDEVANPESAVSTHGAVGVDAADDSAAQLVGKGFNLDA